ncbi:hypothetical protein C8Q75DRAFT_478013 [Abortiporus biennis]|nr:hypothetical protein C8Q75DRAFT_478013 [Abortiporus biennis]
MDGWKDHLHFSLQGEHVLFPGLHLDSTWHFIVASIITVAICLCERALTFAISRDWHPFPRFRRSRLLRALWKTILYWLVTFGRLLYMLLGMTFNAGLIVVAVTSLSIGQFVIAYLEEPVVEYRNRRDPEAVKEPLLSPSSYEPPMRLDSYPTFPSSPSPIFDSYPEHYNTHTHTRRASQYQRRDKHNPEMRYTASPFSSSSLNDEGGDGKYPIDIAMLPSTSISDDPYAFQHTPYEYQQQNLHIDPTHPHQEPQLPSPSQLPYMHSPLPEPTPSTSQYQPPSIQTRPRSRSKPTAIFIHPAESNIARADAAAQQLGLGGDGDAPIIGQVDDSTKWELGKGRDVARELLGMRKQTQ